MDVMANTEEPEIRLTKSAFQSINPKRISDDLLIEQTALEEGRRDRPTTAATDLDAKESEIVNAVKVSLTDAKNKTENALSEYIQVLDQLRTGFFARLFVSELGSVIEECVSQASILYTKHKNALLEKKEQELQLLRNMRYFCAENKLNREARYPDSKIFHMSVLAAIAAIESVGNAYFFSAGSELGLLGGWLLAILLSLFILGSGQVFGAWALPYVNHIRRIKVALALVGVSLYLFLIILFCLAIAHYRRLLTIDPKTAAERFISEFWAAPFALDPMSWTLFGVSLFFAITAVLNGYMSDDVYPGYGELDRRYRAATKAYSQEEQRFIDLVTEQFNRGIASLNRVVADAQAIVNRYGQKRSQANYLISGFERHATDAQDICGQLLKLYRDKNQQVRTSAPPAYFQTAANLGSAPCLSEIQLNKLGDDVSLFAPHMRQLREADAAAKRSLAEHAAKIRNQIPTFVSEVAAEAERRVDMKQNAVTITR